MVKTFETKNLYKHELSSDFLLSINLTYLKGGRPQFIKPTKNSLLKDKTDI